MCAPKPEPAGHRHTLRSGRPLQVNSGFASTPAGMALKGQGPALILTGDPIISRAAGLPLKGTFAADRECNVLICEGLCKWARWPVCFPHEPFWCRGTGGLEGGSGCSIVHWLSCDTSVPLLGRRCFQVAFALNPNVRLWCWYWANRCQVLVRAETGQSTTSKTRCTRRGERQRFRGKEGNSVSFWVKGESYNRLNSALLPACKRARN